MTLAPGRPAHAYLSFTAANTQYQEETDKYREEKLDKISSSLSLSLFFIYSNLFPSFPIFVEEFLDNKIENYLFHVPQYFIRYKDKSRSVQ